VASIAIEIAALKGKAADQVDVCRCAGARQAALVAYQSGTLGEAIKGTVPPVANGSALRIARGIALCTG
jgi:hypothetical protein